MKLFGNSRNQKNMPIYGGEPSEQEMRSSQPVSEPAEKPVPKQKPEPAKAKPVPQTKAAGEDKSGGMSGTLKGILLLLGSIILFLAVLIGCLFVLYDYAAVAPNKPARPQGNDIVVHTDPFTGETLEVVTPTEPVEEIDTGTYNILIVGTDGDGTRTDTIMVANLNLAEKSVALMSIPRDTFVYGNAIPKINGVYGAYGKGEKGINALKKTIHDTLGFMVDGYVIVDLEAFVKIVDLVGGVRFNVPMNMKYDDPTQNLHINLKKGWQLLDGAHAIQLCRYRKGYSNADIGRTSVQQQFVMALAQKCVETISLSKIPEYAEIVNEYVTTDLTLGNMIFFGEQLLGCDIDNMHTVTLPGDGAYYHGSSVWVLHPNATLEIINEHFNPYTEDLTRGDLNIRTSDVSYSKPSGGSNTEEDDLGGDEGGSAEDGNAGVDAGTDEPEPTPEETPDPGAGESGDSGGGGEDLPPESEE